MKTIAIRLFLLLFAVTLVISTSAQNWQWLRSAGGHGSESGEIVDVDDYGNVVITGKFSDTAWFGSAYLVSEGDNDVFIAKYDSAGTLLWVRGAGGPYADESVSVSFDPMGNVYFTGYYKVQATFGNQTIFGNNDLEFYVAKYNSAGTFQWVRKATGPGDDRGKGIDCDNQGNVLVTGSYRNTCLFDTVLLSSPGDDNVFLVKYGPGGDLLWILDGGGPSQAWTSTVSTDAANNVYITGSFRDTAVFGSHTVISYGGNDVLLAKASHSGTWLWAVNGGGTFDDYGNGMEVDVFGNVAVTGSFFDTVVFSPAPSIASNGSKDGFIAYYNSDGNGLWANAMGGLQSDKGIACSTDKDGFVYVTGFINGIAHFGSVIDTAVGGDDMFLAKYDPNGNLIFEVLAGGTGNDYGKGIEVDDQGVVYIGGGFQNTMYFGNQTLSSEGGSDIMLVKYSEGLPLLIQQPQNTDACVGDTVTLSLQAAGTGPFNYLWFDDAGSILGAVNSSYSFVCANTNYSGKYYCQVGNAKGGITSDTAIVTVHPLPLVNFNVADSTFFFFDTILYISVDAGYSSYLWSTGDTNYFISYFGYFPGYQQGWNTFYVTIVNAFGCEQTDSVIMFVLIGIEENEANGSIGIFPNPASDVVSIRSSESNIRNLKIMDVRGRQVYADDFDNAAVEVDLSAFSSGMYYLHITTSTGMSVRKLILY